MEETKLSDWATFYQQQCDLITASLARRERVMERYQRRFGARLKAQYEADKKPFGVRFYFKELTEDYNP